MHKKTRVSHTHETGLGLMEILLVVGIGAVLLLGGLATYRMVLQDAKINKTIEGLLAIKNSVQKLFGVQSGYGVLPLNGPVFRGGGFPSGFRVDASVDPPAVTHPLAGPVIVTGQNNHFTIELRNISSGECVKIGKIFESEADDDFRFLDVNNGAITNFTPATGITVTNLAPACTGPVVHILFGFN